MKDIVAREKTVFENQKADMQRLLGAEGRPKRPHREFPHGGGCVCSRCKRVWNIFGYIDHLEQDQTDALALLDNMDEEAPPENPKEPNINIYGHVHGRIHIDKGVYLHLHGDIDPSKPDDYEGPWPYELLNTGTIWPQSQLPPAEDVGCPQSDAMGGEEPDRHFDTATVDPHKQWEAPSRRLEVPAEEPEKEVEDVDLFRMGGITYFAEVPKKEGE